MKEDDGEEFHVSYFDILHDMQVIQMSTNNVSLPIIIETLTKEKVNVSDIYHEKIDELKHKNDYGLLFGKDEVDFAKSMYFITGLQYFIAVD